MTEKKILRLILGDQLNPAHIWFAQQRADVIYTLMEVRQETDYVLHHIQKVVGFFAAMRRFAEQLESKGHRIIYLHLDDPRNQQRFDANLAWIIRQESITCWAYQQPDEYRLDRQLADTAVHLDIPVEVVATEHFLTDRGEVKKFFQGKKRFIMESFYRHMRKKHQVLLKGGKPVGGKWNYDQSNRARYDGQVPVPPPNTFKNDVTPLVEMLSQQKIKTFGQIDPQHFIWPIDRKQALAQLEEFIQTRLANFGTYQDAMTVEAWSLFHSRLSFALNTKILHPMEVIQAAIASLSDKACSPVAIEQVEGFVRQILGWREYIRGIYWSHMPGYEEMNYFEHTAPLPDFYWTGRTRMTCIRCAVEQSLKFAYAHHIQRLMVTGNFALLAGVAPRQVDAWYLGIYIDAEQWVEIVNTLGMSQFADGGIVATKPYISSANYIRKMSNYCDDCEYDHQDKTGSHACPFNSLYWDFLARHRERLRNNPRIGMMYRTWDRMADANQKALLRKARHYKDHLNDL